MGGLEEVKAINIQILSVLIYRVATLLKTKDLENSLATTCHTLERYNA